jgi:thiamine biosynthesis lipoprotein
MGTIVSIEVLEPADASLAEQLDEGITRAFEWFHDVERRCSRFDEHSELRALTRQAGTAVSVSALVYNATQFALAVAQDTHGAFDPTIGLDMEARGFDRHYLTGRRNRTTISSRGDTEAGYPELAKGAVQQPEATSEEPPSYRDVVLDASKQTILLRQPLLLDLGAVAKGLAIDLAAQELAPFGHFVIDAGGDLYVAGLNAKREPWTVGIRHPRRDREVIERLALSDCAICTSGDYERTGPAGHHILDPRHGGEAAVVASATVIAPTAMAADALATAAFVLGPDEGLALLERHGVDGLLVSPSLERFTTRGLSAAILPLA